MTPLRSLVAMVFLVSSGLNAQLLVAHRGASHVAPENTLAAFRLAWEEGADAIEGDFHLSADGHIVCIHDKDTKRTAGSNQVVRRSSLASLRKLDVGSWKAERFRGERIPTLDEVLELVPRGKRLFLEVKCGPEIVPPLKACLKKQSAELRSRITVICFDARVIAAVKTALPRIPAYWLSSFKKDKKSGRRPGAAETLAVLKKSRADGLDCQANPGVVTPAFVSTMRAAGMELHTWTVDDPALAARFRRLGFASITTNRPAFLRENLPSVGLAKAWGWGFAKKGPRLSLEHPGASASVPGVFGPAIDLGKSKSLEIPESLPERGAFMLWYAPRRFYDYQTILDTAAHPNRWEMWIDGRAILHFRVDRSSAWLRHALHPRADVERWLHLGVSWDRKDSGPEAVRLFVDGREVATSSWRGARWFAPGAQTFLGGGHPKNTKGTGRVEDFALFDRPLRAADMHHAYRQGLNALLEL